MKKKIILWMMLTVMLSSVLLSGCQLIPVEEELPMAPIIHSNEVEEYRQVTVVRKDLVAIDTVSCKYEALQKEELAFQLGGEAIGNVYVQLGQTVEAGDLLAELVHDSLADRIKSQEYQMSMLRMQKRHLQALKALELARQDAMIADLDARLEDVNKLLEQRTEWDELWKAYEEQLKQWELDMELWESQQKEPETPETTVPEETIPENTVPDATVPDTSVPETIEPDATAPETTEPEETVPQVTVPETVVSAPQKPEEPEKCPVEQTLEELTQQKDGLERSRRDQVSRKVSVTNSYDQQIDSVDDSLYVQQLRMEELEAELEERRIYAGIHGIVSFIKMERVEHFTSSGIVSSNQVGSGQRSVRDETFITVMDTDSMIFTVSGEDAAKFPVGTEVTILCDKREMKAISVEAPEGVEVKEGEECAYLKLETPDPSLEDGTRGDIELIVEQHNNVLCLPQNVIQTTEDQEFVYILNEEGLKTMQDVTTGVRINGYVEILEGLKEGDSVIAE